MDQLPKRSVKYTRASIIAVVLVITVLIRLSMNKEDSSFKKFMRHTASELNKTCPHQLDKETWLDSASVLDKKTFRYNYTLKFPKDSIEVEMFVLSVRPLIASNAKTNSDLQVFRENDVIFEHYFKDVNGKFLTRIIITPQEYLQ